MRLDNRLGCAEQRRAADFLGIHHLFKVLEAALDREIRELGGDVFEEDRLEHGQQRTGDALGQLEDDIAHKTVADDDVGFAFKQVARFDVARKMDAGVGFEALVRFAVERRALVVLGAVVDKRHGRDGAAHDLLRIDAAHGAEGVDHIGAALGVGAAVQQQERLFERGDLRGERRALDALERAHDQAGGDMQRAGGPGRDKGVGLAVFEHGQAPDHAGILFLAGSLDRVVLHCDDLGAVDEFKRRKVDGKFGRGLFQGFRRAEQGDGHALAEFLRSLRRALQHGVRGVVAAHGVQ